MAAVAFGVVALIVVANVHLEAVSLRSQPDCVAHLKVSGAGSDGYRAASSSC
jgi:hypothetical protein